MENYKSPTVNVDNSSFEFRPIRGVIYSMILAILGIMITSIVLGVVFAAIYNIDMLDEKGFEAALAGNSIFLLLDSVIDLAVLFFCGRFLVRYVPEHEGKFAIAIGLIIATIAFFLSSSMPEGSAYPLWYEATSYLVLALGIYVGVYSKRLT